MLVLSTALTPTSLSPFSSLECVAESRTAPETPSQPSPQNAEPLKSVLSPIPCANRLCERHSCGINHKEAPNRPLEDVPTIKRPSFFDSVDKDLLAAWSTVNELAWRADKLEYVSSSGSGGHFQQLDSNEPSVMAATSVYNSVATKMIFPIEPIPDDLTMVMVPDFMTHVALDSLTSTTFPSSIVVVLDPKLDYRKSYLQVRGVNIDDIYQEAEPVKTRPASLQRKKRKCTMERERCSQASKRLVKA